MFFQDGLTGSAWGDWSLYTASPLRARDESKVARNFFGGETTSYASFDPAKELGVQDPIGFWDPLGLSADKDEATFKRRRAVEIKHGRIVLSSGFVRGEHSWKSIHCLRLQHGSRYMTSAFPGHVCDHWLHRSRVLQVPRIPFSFSRTEVCGRAQRPRRSLQARSSAIVFVRDTLASVWSSESLLSR